MASHPLPDTDPLDDFEHRPVTLEGETRTVHLAGRGPAVIVMTEMPGISPAVARFARWVRDAGFTVWMPSLFGLDGVTASAEDGVAVFRRTCVAGRFRALGSEDASPGIVWLRALARRAHAECGGPGVGAVGMCFTGNFALAMMLEPATVAPVVCQPSMPMEDPAAIGLPPADLARIRDRLEREDLQVHAVRFEGDRWCTAARFAAYAQALGPRFVATVLPDAAAHPEPPPFFREVVGTPHSVVTAHLIDEAGQPTLKARDDILRFLAGALGTSTWGTMR